MIELKNIYKEYKSKSKDITKALDDISLVLPPTGMVFITGKSGSGKSTLLNIIGCLDKPTSGSIFINNKSLSNLKNKQIDAYRNNYIGFIFQDYNLLENFNVYKNIELALTLQKKKVNNNYINDYLSKVGLKELSLRKVNELSGGQKQRVAIVRALIKNPNIILADEPTGNLDIENSEQICNILKQVSKDKLVVIVSHNTDLANKYADRIIELENGKIIRDNIVNQINPVSQELNLIKTRLPFFKSISLAFSNLKKKKIRLMITSLIVTVILSSLGLSIMLMDFDINKTHAETMVRENETRVDIRKKILGENFTTDNPVVTFTSKEIDEVTKKLNTDSINVSKPVENNAYLYIDYAFPPMDGSYDSTEYAYYNIANSSIKLLPYSDDKLNELKVIGELPKENNEVIIRKVYADYLIKNGVRVYGKNKEGKEIIEDYFPKDYTELTSSNKKIVFGSSYVIISGILDEDLSKYDELKILLMAEVRKNPNKLHEEFTSKYKFIMNDIIIKKDSITSLNLKPNTILDMTFYSSSITYKENEFYMQNEISKLGKEVTIFDGKKMRKISKLGDNEILLGSSMINDLTNNDALQKFMEYYEKETDKYNTKVKEREEQIKKQEEQMLIDPDYVYEEISPIMPLDYNSMYEKYMKDYIISNKIIGSNVNLEISDLYLRTQNQKHNTYNLKVVGYIFDDYNTYISDSVLDSYMRENIEVSNIYFNENNVEKLEQIFDDFPSKDAKYISETMFTKTMDSIAQTVKHIKKIAYYVSLGLLIFSIVVLTNYIISSINSSKKTIGILRSLGARTKDIFKIFYLEAFLLGLSSVVLSSAITYFACIYLNNIISSELFYKARPIIYNYKVPIYIMIFIFLLVTISSGLSLIKISKQKPVEAIYEK